MKILVYGAGAIGGYTGALMAKGGEDVTLVDPWPEHVEYIRKHGMQLSGQTPAETHSIQVPIRHISDVQDFSREKPIDIAFISVKSYDTEWATHLIKPYLAPNGYVVSLQNCINEERIAAIVGCLLSIANQGDVLLSQPFSTRIGVKLFLNFLIPFTVSSVSAVLNRPGRE